MGVGDIANEWLGAVPIGSLYSVGGAANDWLYTLTPGDFLPSPRPPLAVATMAPLPATGRSNNTRSTSMDTDLYGDPLTRLALGQAGTVDPAGPYYGGVDPSYQVFNLSDAAIATQRLFPGWTLPKIGLPALGFPNTPKATQQQAAPGAGWATWLLYGGLALAAVLLLRRR